MKHPEIQQGQARPAPFFEEARFPAQFPLGVPLPERVGFNPAKEPAMRTTQQMSITLPNEMADAVKTKVHTGEYASESEVIRDGLRTLMARDRAVESWLRNQVGPACDALKADPSRAVTAAQVRERLAAQYAKAR
jgi:putative addiction module CopG family antidote